MLENGLFNQVSLKNKRTKKKKINTNIKDIVPRGFFFFYNYKCFFLEIKLNIDCLTPLLYRSRVLDEETCLQEEDIVDIHQSLTLDTSYQAQMLES